MLTHRYVGQHNRGPQSSVRPSTRLLVAPLAGALLLAGGGTALAATHVIAKTSGTSSASTATTTTGAVVANAGMMAYPSFTTSTGPRITPTINKTGRVIISKPGVYSGWNITAGNIDIQSNGGAVILEDFVVDARGTTAGGPVWVRGGFTSTVEVRFGRVIGAGNVGSTCVNMLQPFGWAHDLDVSNCEDGFRAGHNTIIEKNWIHGLFMGAASHNDGIQLQGTEQDVEIRNNRIDGRYRGQTSAFLIKSDTSNITRINVHHNYLSGGAYTAYVYDAGSFRTTAVKMDNNVFIRGTALYSQLATLVTAPALSNSGIVSKVGNTWDDGTQVWGGTPSSSSPAPSPSTSSSTPAPSPSSSTPAPSPSTSSAPAPSPSTSSSTPAPSPSTSSSTPAPSPSTSSSTPAPSPSTSSTPPPAPGTRPAYASYPALTGSITAPSAMPIQKTGLYIISSPGTYSGIHVTNGNIEIRANDVTLTDFAITNTGYNGTGNLLRVYPGFSRHVISYGTLSNDNGYGWGLYPVKDTYAHHLDISGTGDGIQVGINGKYEYMWIHDLIVANGGHVDAIQLVGGREGNTEIAYSRLEGPYRGQTSAIIIKADLGNINGVNVHDNYLSGGSYTVYAYSTGSYTTTNVKLDRNVFMRGSSLYGTLSTSPAPSPAAQITSKTGNTWDDGSLIWG